MEFVITHFSIHIPMDVTYIAFTYVIATTYMMHEYHCEVPENDIYYITCTYSKRRGFLDHPFADQSPNTLIHSNAPEAK